MPKKKTVATNKKKATRTRAKTTRAAVKKKTPARAPRARPAARAPQHSAEYLDYLERYKMAGGDRPLLSPKEFDRLDDELLDLLALQLEVGLDDEQVVRLQELEYLLLESEQ